MKNKEERGATLGKCRIAVVGSRSFTDYTVFKEEIGKFLLQYSGVECCYSIISGGAKGADALARRYAKEKNIPLTEIVPDWLLYGRSAGIKRNAQIVAECDVCIAFWDGKSPGTKNTIDRCRRAGKSVSIVDFLI